VQEVQAVKSLHSTTCQQQQQQQQQQQCQPMACQRLHLCWTRP
jgi:hypothetical protein